MPRDEWARANARVEYGPIAQKRRDARQEGRHDTAEKHLADKTKSPERVASRFSPESKLWFGKHKESRIADVPRDYLAWIIHSHEPGKFWRMDGLVLFLRRYLKLRHAPENQTR